LKSTTRRVEVATSVHQASSGHAPSYLADDCCLITEALPTRLHLANTRFSIVGRGPTSATEPSVQLDLESGTICRRTSDSRTCHTAVRFIQSLKTYLFLVSRAKVQCGPRLMSFRNPFMYDILIRNSNCISHGQASLWVRKFKCARTYYSHKGKCYPCSRMGANVQIDVDF